MDFFMTKISILCPTKGRASLCNRMVTSVFNTVSNKSNVEILLGVVEPYHAIKHVTQHKVPEWSTAMTWNYLASKAEGDLLMLGADDTIFATPGWDEALLDHYGKLENKIHVYHLQDSRDIEGTPHPIVTREYYNAIGYFVPPIFFHWYVDSWTREIAKYNSIFTHLKEFELVHDKPSDLGKPDATHTGIRSQGWHDRDKFVHENCQHFLQQEQKRLWKIMNIDIHNKRIAEIASQMGEFA